MTKSSTDMIKVPFPSRFILESAAMLYPIFGLEKEQSHDFDSISAVFEADGFKNDALRAAWYVDGKRVPQLTTLDNTNYHIAEYFDRLQTFDPAMNLTDREVEVLFAFAMSSDRQFSQGGVFRGMDLLPSTWLVWHDIFSGGQEEEVNIVRPSTYHPTSVQRLCVKTKRYSPDIFSFECQSHISVRDVNGKETFFCDLDEDKSFFQVSQLVWERILESAKQQLAYDTWGEIILVSVIPCLTDEKVAELFHAKIAQQSVDMQEKANKLIAACYGVDTGLTKKLQVVVTQPISKPKSKSDYVATFILELLNRHKSIIAFGMLFGLLGAGVVIGLALTGVGLFAAGALLAGFAAAVAFWALPAILGGVVIGGAAGVATAATVDKVQHSDGVNCAGIWQRLNIPAKMAAKNSPPTIPQPVSKQDSDDISPFMRSMFSYSPPRSPKKKAAEWDGEHGVSPLLKEKGLNSISSLLNVKR